MADGSPQVDAVLEPYNADIVVLAGYMCFYQVPPQYEGRVINIHPALLPNFGGQGMYGHPPETHSLWTS